MGQEFSHNTVVGACPSYTTSGSSTGRLKARKLKSPECLTEARGCASELACPTKLAVWFLATWRPPTGLTVLITRWLASPRLTQEEKAK